jgi:hypothetical protein
VALNIRKGAWTDTFKNYGQAWRVIVMMCLGMVYPLTILSPWPEMRDMVNVVDKVTWAQFGHYAVVLWMTALFVVPLTFWLMTRLGMKLSGSITEQTQGVFSSSTGDYFKKTMPALIPMGLSFWATFFPSGYCRSAVGTDISSGNTMAAGSVDIHGPDIQL